MALRSELFKQGRRIILHKMRVILALLMSVQAPAVRAPTPPPWQPGMPWEPTAPYVTAGQDELGYRNWYATSPSNAFYVRSFNNYLTTYGVSGVIPTWQLLRTASDWQKCASAPFEVPPPNDWPNIIQALRYIREQVVPAIGAVEAVSVYRNEVLNVCAKGAQESAHRFMQAIDLVPLQPISRPDMMARLCAAHALTGERYGVGLGFYVGMRFHVDSRSFRTWGVNDQGTISCARSFEIAHAKDAAQAPPTAVGPPETNAPR